MNFRLYFNETSSGDNEGKERQNSLYEIQNKRGTKQKNCRTMENRKLVDEETVGKRERLIRKTDQVWPRSASLNTLLLRVSIWCTVLGAVLVGAVLGEVLLSKFEFVGARGRPGPLLVVLSRCSVGSCV